LTAVLEAARAGHGYPCTHIVAKKDESEVAFVSGAGLIEMRAGAGHYTGHSQGVSIPIGSLGGRSIRYRVGAQKGHFVAGTPEEKVVDQGQLVITSQRIVFLGTSRTSECAFGKLLSIQQAPGRITVSVSNRQKPTVVQYGTKLDGWIEMRLGLALAIYRGEAAQFADVMEANLRDLEAEKPGITVPAPLPVASDPPARPVTGEEPYSPVPTTTSEPRPTEGSEPGPQPASIADPVRPAPDVQPEPAVQLEPVAAAARDQPVVAPPPGSEPTPPPPPPPVWSPDPTGRFELRWWDGTRWTEHVSTAGRESTDFL